MSIGQVDSELAGRLPLDQIAELCRRHGVSMLSVSQHDRAAAMSSPEGAIRFLISFVDDDFGPWGCKLDQLENDLSGILHRKIHAASRRGIEQSAPAIRRDQIAGKDNFLMTDELAVSPLFAKPRWPPSLMPVATIGIPSNLKPTENLDPRSSSRS